MKLNEYQERSKRTLNFENMTRRDAINQMLLGMSEEAGECQGIFKKHFYQGHKLDIDEVIQEMGDTLFYLSGLATVLGVRLEEVAEGNIAKLKKRYPEGFSSERSVNREV